MVNTTTKFALLFLVVSISLIACKKEDKRSDIEVQLIGTWQQADSLLFPGDSSSTAVSNPITIEFIDGGSYNSYTGPDSSLTELGSGSWSVNEAGTQVDLTGLGDYELVELTEELLVWETKNQAGNLYQERYNRKF